MVGPTLTVRFFFPSTRLEFEILFKDNQACITWTNHPQVSLLLLIIIIIIKKHFPFNFTQLNLSNSLAWVVWLLVLGLERWMRFLCFEPDLKGARAVIYLANSHCKLHTLSLFFLVSIIFRFQIRWSSLLSPFFYLWHDCWSWCILIPQYLLLESLKSMFVRKWEHQIVWTPLNLAATTCI